MKIMTIDASAVEGGKALALCDDDGRMIGRQIACTVSCEMGALPVATIKFHIDGDAISLGDI